MGKEIIFSLFSEDKLQILNKKQDIKIECCLSIPSLPRLLINKTKINLSWYEQLRLSKYTKKYVKSKYTEGTQASVLGSVNCEDV